MLSFDNYEIPAIITIGTLFNIKVNIYIKQQVIGYLNIKHVILNIIL